MLGALEWARVRALAADGLSQREIARRLGINRRTVARLLASGAPPRYRRASPGSQLDRFEPVLRRLLEEWPQIKAPRATEVLREYGYVGSVDVVRRRLRELRPREVRPAQRTGYRPGQVLQLDWAEMPTRPKLFGRERRVYALVASLPYSGAQTAFFSFEMTIESFLEGHARAFEWLEGVPRECVYDNLRSVVARRERDEVVWNQRFLHLRGHYAFHAHACTPATPREKGSVEAAVRYLKTGFWPARRFGSLGELDGQYADWRDDVCNRRRHASGRFLVSERLEEERRALRPLPPERFDWTAARLVRVPVDGYLRFGGCFYRAPASLVQHRVELCSNRDEVWIRAHGITVAWYRRCYEPGTWLPAPIMRPEPPPAAAPPATLASVVTPPELADYAELCA
ncbi:MAG TPA: IS21 family transposase [Gemmatimonadaceae bacterium]|nr:IS21 family transposase [Actinoplanes sp.]HXQ86726.1 IS21 family transposase [Gaiella sp.]